MSADPGLTGTPGDQPGVPALLLRSGRTSARSVKELVIRLLLQVAAYSTITISLGILFVLVRETIPFFAAVAPLEFLTGTDWTPLLEPRQFGVLPLVAGTLLVTLIAGLFVIPVGSLTALYMSEWASGRFRRVLKPFLEILAGVPTVVYGYFALTVVTPALQIILPSTRVFNALAAGLVVGIMIIPTVASLSDDAMRAVPRALRDAAYGLGATRKEVALGVVFPSAFSGIMASYLLAISRAIGETMIVSMAAGSTATITVNPLESIQTITGFIVQVSLGDTPHGTTSYQTIFAVGLLLFAMTLLMNMVSIWIRDRFRDSY